MSSILLKVSKLFPLRKLGRGGEYLHRFLIYRHEKWGAFLHRFLASDSSTQLHCHPWSGFSIILKGAYIEERLVDGRIESKVFRFLDINRLNKDTFHRVDLLTDEVWTLFIRFKKPKKEDYKWGFVDRNTLEYTDSNNTPGLGELEDID